MSEISFDHRCDPNDISIAKHTDTVRNVLRSTQLSDTIQSAHAYNRDSTEQPEPISMGPNFFLDAGDRVKMRTMIRETLNRKTPIQRTAAPQKVMRTLTAPARTLTHLIHPKTRTILTRNDGFNPAGGKKASDTAKYVSAALSSS
jgi:hypothetical protein